VFDHCGYALADRVRKISCPIVAVDIPAEFVASV
jgi:hypothetical protein